MSTDPGIGPPTDDQSQANSIETPASAPTAPTAMSDLREKLADRLAWVFGGHHAWNTDEVVRAVGRDTLLKMADECIRQMEWARSQPLAALAVVQDADEHDGQYDGCSLCHYHAKADWLKDPKWAHLAEHEADCVVGNALKAVLTPAPDDWRPE